MREVGHCGETLHLVEIPDEIVEQRPAVCAHYQTPLADASAHLCERRQVHELPMVRLRVTEYQVLHVRCPHCQRVSEGTFPAEAPSRAQYGLQLRALAVYLVEEQFVPLALFCHVGHEVGKIRPWHIQWRCQPRPFDPAAMPGFRRPIRKWHSRHDRRGLIATQPDEAAIARWYDER